MTLTAKTTRFLSYDINRESQIKEVYCYRQRDFDLKLIMAIILHLFRVSPQMMPVNKWDSPQTFNNKQKKIRCGSLGSTQASHW